MCEVKYNATRLVGKDMNVVAVAGDKETLVTIDSNYGDIVGISIGETYSRAQLGQVNLTLVVDSVERIINAPLTQFLPDGERQMWPMAVKKGTIMKAKLAVRVAGLDVNVPIPLVFHCVQEC